MIPSPPAQLLVTPKRGTRNRRCPVIQLLNVQDVADVLAIPVRAVYDLVESRDSSLRLRVVRIGRRVRFDPADVAAWVEGHRS
ncbi:MAG: helix-turn-helix domain-containing protein [Actinomycetota bacterium]